MRYWDILRTRLRSLIFRSGRESDLGEELQFHLDRETERLQASGLSAEAARLAAKRMFGGVEHIKDDCRDARGTALVESSLRDVVYALKGFLRTPLVTGTIVSTVAIGLGLVAVAFTMLNMLLFRADEVPNLHEMFAVERPPTAQGEPARFTRADLDRLQRETDVFTDAYAEIAGIDIYVEGRRPLCTFATGNIFQVIGVNAVLGRTLVPEDDEPAAGRAVLVLSHRGWDRLFARAPNVVGRVVVINGVSFEVVGVMPEGFRGLAVVPPDYWVPLSMLGHVRAGAEGREADAGVRIVGRLRPGMSRQTAVAGLGVWAAVDKNGRAVDRSAASVTLIPWRGTVPETTEAMLVTGPLFVAFGLILLIGCANVMNLLLARSVARQREIGIRLSLGAGRARIVRQLLTESMLLALIAAAAGYAISRVTLDALVNAMLASWPAEIGDLQLLVPDADWRVLLFLLVGGALSAMAFGLAPALQATRIEPVRTMRGEVMRDAKPGRARDVLIGIQVSASALLLICAAVFLKSALTASTVDPGLRVSDTIAVEIANERHRTAMVQALRTEPLVASVAASWPGLADGRRALAEAAVAKGSVVYRFVSPEYFTVLDVAVVRGRTFTSVERASTLPIAVVSETTARVLWPNADPIGHVLRLDPDASVSTPDGGEPRLGSRTFSVVGVVRDVSGYRVMPLEKAVVYVPGDWTMPRTALVARVRGNPELARQALYNRLTLIDPKFEQVASLGAAGRMETYFLQIGFWSTVVLGGLALALTLSGVFSVLSYLVEQRTREIGVRMALGATTTHVTKMVLWQSVRPVGVGLLVGGGAAAALSAWLLTLPAADIIGQIVRVHDPLAYSASVLVIFAACLAAAAIPAARAARLDPTRSLRQN